MKNILLIGALIIIIIVGIVFLNNAGKNMSSSNPALNPTSQTIAPNNVSIENFSFNPLTLTVRVGTTVTWTNNDSTAHSLKSSSFNSVALNTGDTFKFTFKDPGTFNYSCGIHPTMTGTIIVK